MGGSKCFMEGFNVFEAGFMEGRRLYDMVRVRVVLGGFYDGYGSDYKYGLKYIFVWGVKTTYIYRGVYMYLSESGWGSQQCGMDILGGGEAVVILKDHLIH